MARKVLYDRSGKNISWLEETVEDIKIIGHAATVNEIYEVMQKDVIAEVPKSARTPTQTIYGQIYIHSYDSKAGRGKEHIFILQGRCMGVS